MGVGFGGERGKGECCQVVSRAVRWGPSNGRSRAGPELMARCARAAEPRRATWPSMCVCLRVRMCACCRQLRVQSSLPSHRTVRVLLRHPLLSRAAQFGKEILLFVV
jgi:hypothetical protein